MFSLQVYKFQDTFKTERIILSFFGFYPYRDPGKFSWKLLKRICVLTSLIIFIGQMILMLFYMNFSDMIEPWMIWITEFGFFCKLIAFLCNGENILKLVSDLNDSAFSRFPKEYLKSLEKEIRFTGSLTNIYRLVIVSYASYISLLQPFIKSKHKRSLPFEAHVPCHLEHNDCFISFIIFQAINAVISSQTNVNMECLFCKLMTTCSCLFDVVRKNLRNIDYCNNEQAKRELRQNVILHIKLLR